MTIDWTKPIEAVRKSDGYVFPVTLKSGPDSCGAYTTNECPDSRRSNRQWRNDGSDCCRYNEWFVRNVPETAKSLPARVYLDKAARAAGWPSWDRARALSKNVISIIAHARTLEENTALLNTWLNERDATLAEPTDEARALLDAELQRVGCMYRSNWSGPTIQAALRAITVALAQRDVDKAQATTTFAKLAAIVWESLSQDGPNG